MLLAVSLGNTNIAFGLFENASLIRQGRVALEDLLSLPDRVGLVPVSQIALASVTPSRAAQAIPLLAQAYKRPVRVAGRELPFEMEIQCDDPSTVGADRLLNAVAAYAYTQCATIVADVGTAVTVDLVSERGTFCGGAIVPGPVMMLRALAEFAEQLPAVSLQEPPSPVGRSTSDAMRSGAWYGAIGLVKELIARIADEQSRVLPVIVTGGAGEFVTAELSPPVEYVPHLTLEGLAILAARNDE